jgi:putative ABC transport system substrate-binding protein
MRPGDEGAPIQRRDFLAALLANGTAFAFVAPLHAQAPRRMVRVGLVGAQAPDAPLYVAFRNRMKELGYQEDKNFIFEFVRTPSIEAYEESFRELAARRPDIMIAAGNEPALRAARAAAGSLPIVFLAIDFDPVAKGFVQSLARPGGNITGIFVHPLELAAKRIELAREAFPQARRLALISDSASADQVEAAAVTAPALGFESHRIELEGHPPDYAAAFAQLTGGPDEPVIIPGSPIFLRDRAQLEHLLLDRRIPSIAAFRELAEAGALMSYGTDLIGVFGDIAVVVDQIVKGANPADLPITPSSRFHLAVNLKSASALGIALPLALTARADEVFE